ncbi:MAG: ATP-binding protein, partial [Flavobacteriales bacterium]|nr:ATP-binding protein [Flavobacteriales bacterium]
MTNVGVGYNGSICASDFGLQGFDNYAREALMDIIEDRYNLKSTIVSSQIPVASWYELIGKGTIADAILD